MLELALSYRPAAFLLSFGDVRPYAPAIKAAGGIADGRGLAAALALGAHGAMIGTRFYAAVESLGHDRARSRIVAARAADTARTRVFDIVRGLPWPDPYTGRALRNRFFERWHGRERALASDFHAEAPKYRTSAAEGDFDTAVIFAGEAVELIHGVARASDLVQQIGNQAEAQLRSGSGLLG